MSKSKSGFDYAKDGEAVFETSKDVSVISTFESMVSGDSAREKSKMESPPSRKS